MNQPVTPMVTDPLRAGASRKLAGHVAGMRYEQLPPEAIHAFKRALLDYTTCAVAGSAMPVSQALLSYFEESDATRVASVVGSSSRLSAPNAALVNGANCHGLDFDDGVTHGSAHPSGAIYPAILAAAQQHKSAPKDILLAAVMGYDTMARIAAAMHPATARRGFHNTAIAGVFGAAAGVSKLLGLNADQTLNALGLAGSFAGGIREYLDEGAEIKRVHPGKAARDGIVCAELAKRGITGPAKVLEGRYGFFHTHADDQVKYDRLLEGLGTRFEIAHNYFKPYPCCRHYHAVVDGILELREKHAIRAEDVAGMELGIYAVGVNGHDHKHFENLLDAQMSAPCAAAMAVVDGAIVATNFLPEGMSRPEIKRLTAATEARLDDECERIYPGIRSGAVKIRMKNGTVLEKRVLEPKGEVKNPMTDADLEKKFAANCAPVVGEARAQKLRELIWNFDKLTDCSELYNWK